ncbi:MAG: hypothetical protein ACE5JV_01070 [Nitrososphaerales archaeon]
MSRSPAGSPSDRVARDSIPAVAYPTVGLAVILLVAGALGYLSFNPMSFRGIGVGFIIYFVSYIVVRFSIGRDLPPTDYRKMITTGMPGYVFMFMFIWILYNTFTFAEQTG